MLQKFAVPLRATISQPRLRPTMYCTSWIRLLSHQPAGKVSTGDAPHKADNTPKPRHLSPQPEPVAEAVVAPTGFAAKLKHAFHKYGYIAIALYTSMYLSQLGIGYVVLAEFNNFGMGVADLMVEGRLGKHLPSFMVVSANTSISEDHLRLMLAWAATEIAEPIRFPLTLALSPLVRRVLDRRNSRNNAK